jgi:hypothetical protein
MTASVRGIETRTPELKRSSYAQNHQVLCIIFLLDFSSDTRTECLLSMSIVVALRTSYSSVSHIILLILYENPAAYEFDMGRDIYINALNGCRT